MPKNRNQHPKMVDNGTYHIMGSTIPLSHTRIRVLFDCSAEFKGRSINKVLIPRPDFTNQLDGIITRFRENKVAFMAEIEKMRFQMFVAEEHQCLLTLH